METQVKAKPKLKVIKDTPSLLKPGEMGAILELIVKDKNGKVIKHRTMKSGCFVRQFLELLYVEFQKLPEKAPLLMKDIDGLAWYIWNEYRNFDCDGAVAAVNKGIIAGTGTTAPTIDDYVMETVIPHDAAPPTGGAMQYGGVTFGAPTVAGGTSYFTITRDLVNASGGAITINEIGIYVKARDITPADRYFLIIRDVIAGGILVNNGQTLTVNYKEQVAV